jgi:ketosteroid isomerase-like protein
MANSSPDSSAHETDIRQCEERLRLAMLSGDLAELDALIDDRLLFVGPDGNVYSKENDLGLHRSGSEKITLMEMEDLQMETHPSLAVVIVVAKMAGTFKGQPFAGRSRYLRTWVNTTKGWRIVGGSVCNLSD